MNTKHYPSLELCKKLTEIGFPKTEKFYAKPDGKAEFIESERFGTPEGYEINICPSVMEMLDAMPPRIKMNGIVFYGLTEKPFVVYDDGLEIREFNGNFPNALAEIIIWLHENNYIKF